MAFTGGKGMFTINYMELARGLKNSNISEVSELAQGYLKLAEKFDSLLTSYEELKHAYTKTTAELVMVRHERLFKRLAEYDSNNGDDTTG